MEKLTDQQRQKRIKEHMDIAGVDEATAEFMLAQEIGEVDSDVEAVNESDHE